MKEIFERRSVRQYTEQKIPRKTIEKLLKAAMRAPSACNQQPWEFVILCDRARMSEIISVHPYAKMLEHAPCAIVICGNKQRQVTTPHDYWVQDCSAAAQNLLLEAVHLGLGGVWLGVYPIESRVKGVQKILGLPEHVVPLNVIALGYPAKPTQPIDTYNPQYIHWEQW